MVDPTLCSARVPGEVGEAAQHDRVEPTAGEDGSYSVPPAGQTSGADRVQRPGLYDVTVTWGIPPDMAMGSRFKSRMPPALYPSGPFQAWKTIQSLLSGPSTTEPPPGPFTVAVPCRIGLPLYGVNGPSGEDAVATPIA